LFHTYMTNQALHVVVLAAGKGSRMRSDLPKVLHHVAGKSLLGHVLDSALALDPECIHIVIGHGKEQVRSAFAGHPSANSFSWVEQLEQLGTGHAVAQAMPAIPGSANVLMLTADVPLITADTLAELVDNMAHHSLALLTAIVDDPHGLGRITRDSGDAVTGIIEEKDACNQQREICEINSGIMCARGEHLRGWLEEINNDNAQQEYYLTDIVGLAATSGEPIAAIQPSHNHEVAGINSRMQLAEAESIYQYLQAQRLMEQGVTLMDPTRVDIRGEVKIGHDTIIDINVVIEGPTTIGSNVRIAPNCVISASRLADNVIVHPNTVIEDSELSCGVRVGPFARLRPGTKLGKGVKIGNFVEIKNAQFGAGSKASHLSYVGDASVGSNTNIGAGVITCNYDGANKHKTIIGDDVFVGSDSQLVAPVTIANGVTIGAGSTITSDVDEGQLAISRGKQRQINGWQRPTKDKKK
jgi:bifunctional UDP-N-acetylglucosamine pyrophosphorylase/glucosamine-1-phosphate N-acetyltransferase